MIWKWTVVGLLFSSLTSRLESEQFLSLLILTGFLGANNVKIANLHMYFWSQCLHVCIDHTVYALSLSLSLSHTHTHTHTHTHAHAQTHTHTHSEYIHEPKSVKDRLKSIVISVPLQHKMLKAASTATLWVELCGTDSVATSLSAGCR